MKNLIYILPFLFLSLISCDGNSVIFPSKMITNSVRVVEYFNEIEVNDGINVTINSYDFVERVFIETNENLHPYIEIFNEADKLVIRRKENVQFNGEYTVNVRLTSGDINVVTASGGSKVNIKNMMKVNGFVAQLSGGSQLAANLTCLEISALTTGGSWLNLTGETQHYTLRSTGGSSTKGYGMTAGKLKCHLSGGSRLEVNVADSLNVEASGGSIISYSGKGIIQSQILSGGSLIKCAD